MSWSVPYALLLFLAWWFSSPASLGEAATREALRRSATPRAAASLTDADADRLTRGQPSGAELNRITEAAGSSVSTGARAAPGAPPQDGAQSVKARGEAWWRDRFVKTQAALDRDRLLADALQTRVNALAADASARDDPVSRGQLNRDRSRAFAELEKMRAQLEADQAAIAALHDEARRAGIPPGWVR